MDGVRCAQSACFSIAAKRNEKAGTLYSIVQCAREVRNNRLSVDADVVPVVLL